MSEFLKQYRETTALGQMASANRLLELAADEVEKLEAGLKKAKEELEKQKLVVQAFQKKLEEIANTDTSLQIENLEVGLQKAEEELKSVQAKAEERVKAVQAKAEEELKYAQEKAEAALGSAKAATEDFNASVAKLDVAKKALEEIKEVRAGAWSGEVANKALEEIDKG